MSTACIGGGGDRDDVCSFLSGLQYNIYTCARETFTFDAVVIIFTRLRTAIYKSWSSQSFFSSGKPVTIVLLRPVTRYNLDRNNFQPRVHYCCFCCCLLTSYSYINSKNRAKVGRTDWKTCGRLLQPRRGNA